MATEDNSNYKVSQDFEIIPHQKSKAYPIGVQEWDFIKEKVKLIKIEVSNFHAFGFLLLGCAGSCLITILATNFKAEDSSDKYFCWAIFAVSLICGLLCICFAKDKQNQENTKPTEIVSQMDLIESRFKK